MEDAVPAGNLNLNAGRNQVALFANPFRNGVEEALVIDQDGHLTYLFRDESSLSGWNQRATGPWNLPLVGEVVVAVLPSGSLWAVCLPRNAKDGWVFLRLEAAGPSDDVPCKWTVHSDAVTPPNPPVSPEFGLHLSYAPDGSPTIASLAATDIINKKYTAVFLSVRFGDTTQSAAQERWTQFQVTVPGDLFGFELAGCGYLRTDSFTTRPHYVMYLWNPGAQQLYRIDVVGGSTTVQPLTVPGRVCGTWNVPALPQYSQQSDVGFVTLTPAGQLEFWYGSGPSRNTFIAVSSLATPYIEASIWQDAYGFMHVFGRDGAGTLYVLHQAAWGKPPQGGDWSCGPMWTRAKTKDGPDTVVIVGVRDGVASYLLDPYPDYKSTEWIERTEDILLSERFCICTQDVTTDRWATENIRLPSSGDPHLIKHYVADATLLDSSGSPVPDHPVIVSADTLAQITVAGKTFQVGPGRSVPLRTNALGKLCIGILADDLNPPVVQVNSDGMEAGAVIDFASQVNGYLAGRSLLPSQSAPLSVATLDAARTTDSQGVQHDLMNAKWRRSTPAEKQGFVDLVRNLYGIPVGETLKVALEGHDEPQEVAGCVFQVWDPHRPAFEAFRTEDEMAEYQAYVESHPHYGGLWEWFVERVKDVWEGIKTGAAKIASVFINGYNHAVSVSFEVGNTHVFLPALVLYTGVEAAQLVGAAFQMVVDTVINAIGWLMSLLKLSDIWDTKVALEQGLDDSLDMFGNALTYAGTVARNWFAEQKQVVNETIDALERVYADTRLGDFTNKAPGTVPSAAGGAYSTQELNTPHANWFYDKLMALADGVLADEPTPAKQQAATSLTGLFEFLAQSPEFKTLTTSFQGLMDELVDPFKNDTSGSASRTPLVALLELARRLLNPLLDALDAIVNKVLEFAADAVTTFKNLLDEPIASGLFLVDALYRWVWKQARPTETPQPMTVGGLVTLLAAFPITVVHKLVNGVDNPPFPGGTYPSVPQPPWTPGSVSDPAPPGPPCGGSPHNWSRNLSMVECQRAGAGMMLLGPAASIWSDLVLPFWNKAPKGLKLYSGNAATCSTGLLNVLLSFPAVGGDFGRTWASLGPFCVNVVRLVLDGLLSFAGPLLPFLERSSLLKNAGINWDGKELKESDNVTFGAILHFILGATSFGFAVASTEVNKLTINRYRWDLGTAAMVCGFVPDITQLGRAALYKSGKLSFWALVALAAITVVNLGCSIGGTVCARLPGILELDNRPYIPPDQQPKPAEVGQTDYEWEITTFVGQHPVNEKPNWPRSPEDLQKKFTFESEDWGPFTAAQVSGKAVVTTTGAIPADAPCCVVFTVIGEDGYGPPLCTRASFVIPISGTADTSLVIRTTRLPEAQVSEYYATTLRACGGTQPYTWSLSDGTLPAQMKFDRATATISGTPWTTGSYSFKVTVMDSSSPPQITERVMTLVVARDG